MKLTAHELVTKMFPRTLAAEFQPFWEECLRYADINTSKRLAMFVAQIAQECGGFTSFFENLNYSASRLVEVWPSRFRPIRGTDDKTKPVFADGKRNPEYYARNPELLANYVYANRNGNGNTASGDGWRYRGRGPKQITGKSNYQAFTNDVGQVLGADFVKFPELLGYPQWGLWAAVWFWKKNKLNQIADAGQVRQATKVINGGYTGLKERKNYYDHALKLLT